MSTVPSTSEPPATTDGEWVVRPLGSVSPDGPAAMVEVGGDVWVARPVGETSELVVSILDPASVREVGLDFRRPVLSLAMASTPVGVVVVASGYDDFVPHVWVSAAGEQWSASTITSDAVDVVGVVWSHGRLIAAGSERTGADPSMGPFRPALFASTDGSAWTEVTVDDPAFSAEGTLGSPVVVGDRVIVPAQLASGTALFESFDGGETWTRVDDDDRAPSWLTTVGDVLVGSSGYDPASGREQTLVLDRSGRWEPVDIEHLTGPSQYQFAFPIGSGAPVFVVESERSIEYCYDDPDGCGLADRVVVIVDENGTPSAVDLGVSDIDPGTATIADDGTLHLLLATGQGLELRSWPASQGPPPSLPPVTVAEPSGPPVVEWDATLEVGETYRFPLSTHCGVDVLGRFNGVNWWLSETPSGEFSGNGGSVFGEIHVVTDDRIDYVLDGRTVAVYEPRPDEFPGCD